MNDHSNLDRETFQQLLASAFAVQESQISRQSLSAILDIQRSIASGKLDLDGAMQVIVESGREVANASGVAIGLLRGDRLIYRAGSGSSAAFVGQHVTASLTVSAFTKTSREILRVEDAQNDTRIEADICRQFGANSLLMLPIYFDRVVAGVLDIRFNDAHTFQDREVRAYRLMAEQIEVALSQTIPLEQKNKLAVEAAFAAHPEEILIEDDSPAPEFWMGESSVPSFFERCQYAFASAKESPGFQRSVNFAIAFVQRAKGFPVIQREKYFRGKQQAKRFFKSSRVRHYINNQRVNAFARMQRMQYLAGHLRVRTLALVSAAVLVAFTGLIAYRRHTPATSLESSTLPKSTAPNQQSSAPDQPESIAKPLPGTTAAEPELTPASQIGRGTIARKRVRLADSEVQYFGDDVTVRTFSPKPAAKRSAVPKNRVTHFGSDVTVRYFASPQPTVRPVSR
jgi:putative methionine-R-sulfoxide reductase with GAF domain